jgi:hypothetical protein
MAQTKKKRRRKHRGTQGGRIDTKGRGRPRSRDEAKARVRAGRNGPRADKPPTWRGSAIRGAFAAAIFTIFVALVMKSPLGASLALGAAMLAIYIPAGYYIDMVLWRRRERARIRAAERQ